MNSRTEWSLEELPVRGCGRVPPERLEVGREGRRIVRALLRDPAPAFVAEQLGIKFSVPENLDRLTRGIVINAGEPHDGELCVLRSALDQPAA